MSIYTLAPLIAAISYIPIIFTTANSRPWQTRHFLFFLFLVSAMLWSFVAFLFRSNLFPELSSPLFKFTVFLFPVLAVQFHCFLSSFFPQGYKRWLKFAYFSLIPIAVIVILGYVTGEVFIDNGNVQAYHKPGVILLALPLLVFAVRDLYVFGKILKHTDNPILHNQVIILILGISIVLIFTLLSLPSWFNDFPIAHYGNLLNAFILSYAVIRHQLIDIRFVLRQGTAWLGLGLVGAVSFWLLLTVLHSIFNFELDVFASFIASLVALIVFIFIYRVRGYFFQFMTRAFQGSSYDYRKKLNEFTEKIHNVFSLKEQGGELLSLLVKALNIKQACLLFPEIDREDFYTQFVEPKDNNNDLSNLKLKASNPIIRYLEREQKPLSRENLNILPSFLGLWSQEKEEIDSKEIELFMPLISRDRLIAILVLGKKFTGRYLLEDFNVIEDVTNRVAVSMEKEYLREQLREREEELSVINSSSVILSSSLDIQEIFGPFLEELKKVIDVHWAAIVLMEEEGLCCVALSSKEGSAFQVGEKLPMEGTGTGWVVTHKKSFIESDLSKEKYFTTGETFFQIGLNTVAYLPLIAKGRAIGSFIIASNRPNAYGQRHVKLLEQLASQIAMPLENTQLYAQAEKKARIDELTGLLNRRSLDEMIDNEISRHSRYGGSFTLAILDLDSFKAYNDKYGHPAGDRLLKQVGHSIASAIRNVDHAFRYGGDEFAVLFPQTTTDESLQVTERVRKRITEELDTGDIPVSASIGLASWPDDGISHTDIIAAADVTLYRAKRGGGNRSYCASATMTPFQISDSTIDSKINIDDNIMHVVSALSETADSRSFYTNSHSKKVTDYSLALGKSLMLSEPEMTKLEICALLHDIGKLCIKDTILNKPHELSAEEWEMVKIHPQIGADIIRRIPQLAQYADGILYHHEWYDGSGYPDGLKGDDIPLEARILAIADSFATMTTERSYSEILTHELAIEELKRCAGKQFDPSLVEKFISIYETKITGNKNKARR